VCTLPYTFRPLRCYETSGPVYPVTERDVTEGRIYQLRRWETQKISHFFLFIVFPDFLFRSVLWLLYFDRRFAKHFSLQTVCGFKKCEGKADKRRTYFENKMRWSTFLYNKTK